MTIKQGKVQQVLLRINAEKVKWIRRILIKITLIFRDISQCMRMNLAQDSRHSMRKEKKKMKMDLAQCQEDRGHLTMCCLERMDQWLSVVTLEKVIKNKVCLVLTLLKKNLKTHKKRNNHLIVIERMVSEKNYNSINRLYRLMKRIKK